MKDSSLCYKSWLTWAMVVLLGALSGCGRDSAGWQEDDRRQPPVAPSPENPASNDANKQDPEAQPEGEPTDDEADASGPDQSDPSADDRPLQDPSRNGRFEFASYEMGLRSDNYQSARIFYPIATEEDPGPFPATTTSGGFTNVKEDMIWFAERMASHGFVVIAFTPTNNLSLDPNIWARGHEASLLTLEEETERIGSPIYQMVDPEKLGISGFSMGGAGTIIAANLLADKVKVAAPFNAFQPVDAEMSAATIFLAGSADTVAIPANIRNSYESLQGSPKAFLNIDGYGHLMTMPGDYEALISTYILSWYHLHLNDAKGYEAFLVGDANRQDIADGVFVEGGYDIELMPELP